MSIYKRDDVNPEWEPIPWDAGKAESDRQEQGFHERALKPIVWKKIDWDRIPDAGIFGHTIWWLQSNDISRFALADNEELFLIDNIWFGFPDPPRWGLLSRPADQNEFPWQPWGHFPGLPDAWLLENLS